jgi:hypothetical protein
VTSEETKRKVCPSGQARASALGQVALYLAIPVVSWFCSLLIEGLLGQLFG